MTELLLRLFGAKIEDAVNIAEASVAFRGGAGAVWVVGGILVMSGLIYRLYRRGPGTLSRARRRVLISLRILFIALVLLLFLRPVLSLTVEGSVRRVLVMLMDVSGSMRIEDPRVEDEDLKRAAIAKGLLAPEGGLEQGLDASQRSVARQVSRVELLGSVLKNERLDLLSRLDRDFDLTAFTFGEDLVELPPRAVSSGATNSAGSAVGGPPDVSAWVDRLEAGSPLTAVGDALREVLNRKRGQPLAGVFLVTDGVNNSGSAPGDAAVLMRQDGVPLYVYGVGITSPRDIIVANVFAPEVTFVRDQVTAMVRVRSQGLEGESAELVLKLGGRVAARTALTFTGAEEQVIPMRFTPDREGEYELAASIEARSDEAVKDNNVFIHPLRVIDAKIKVLMVEQSPRWEFRYLQAMLLRDRRVELKCYLVEGDPGISRAEDSPYLAQLPGLKEELFKYDLVLFGDVDPGSVTAAQLENISELVSKFGGGLVVVAGKRWSPQAYRRGILEQMLPVEFQPRSGVTAPAVKADQPIRLELTAAGRASAMLRLSDKDEENEALWEALPPVYWVSPVTRPKPAAQVLLVDPDPAKETRFGKMPVVALQQYGLGQVMFVGTDNTWRWRKNVGDAHYTAIWGQIAQRVCLQRLLGVSKRTQLSTDRQNYVTGDRVTVFARLYSAGYEPVQEPLVKGLFGLKNGEGARPEVMLRPIPEQPGLYRGELVAPTPGSYQFFVESDPEVPLEFSVSEPQFEFGQTAMNEAGLRKIARETGGAFFREEDLHKVPETITARSELVRSPLEVELWASPAYFLLLLVVVTAEWVLRKMSHLK